MSEEKNEINQSAPVQECAARKALEDLKAEYECQMHDPERGTTYKWSLTRINLALATPCSCVGLREVDDVLTVNWVSVKDGNYRQALADLVQFNIQIHEDPSVSEVAARRKAELDRLREELESSRCGVILQQEEIDSLRTQLAAKEAEISSLKGKLKVSDDMRAAMIPIHEQVKSELSAKEAEIRELKEKLNATS